MIGAIAIFGGVLVLYALWPAARLILRRDAGGAAILTHAAFALILVVLVMVSYTLLLQRLEGQSGWVQAGGLAVFIALYLGLVEGLKRLPPVRRAAQHAQQARERLALEAQAKHNTYQPMVLKDQ